MNFLDRLALLTLVSIACLSVGYVRGCTEAENAAAAAQAKAVQAAQAKYEKAVSDGEARVARLMVENQIKEQQYNSLRQEIPSVSYVYPVGTADPVPLNVVLPYGFVSVWNAALRGEANPPTEGAVDPTTPTRTTPHDLLNNHVENAERCDAIARQLNALIDWEEANRQ